MTNNFFGKHRNLIITCIALVLILAIVVVAVAISSSKDKKTPVPGDSITVTVETEPTAYFNLANNNYQVGGISVLSKTDADLIKNITTLLPFKQSALSYIKNLMDAKKIGAENNNIVLFAVECRNEEDYNKLCTQFKEALKEAGSDAQVYCLYIKVKSEDIETLANNNGTSYAKAYLCRKIAEQDKSLDETKLIKLSITEIINSLVKESSGKEEAEKVIQEVIDGANKEQKETKIKEDKPAKTSSNEASNTSSGETSAQVSGSTSESTSTQTSDVVSDTPSDTPSDTSSETPSEVSSNTSSGNASSTYSRNAVSYVVSNDDDPGWLPGLW